MRKFSVWFVVAALLGGVVIYFSDVWRFKRVGYCYPPEVTYDKNGEMLIKTRCYR